jgi:hypothetical protein
VDFHGTVVLSESTEQRDRGVKFDDYADHGVAEYWIIDCDETSVEQYGLQEGVYKLAQKLKQGEIESLVIAGFGIPIAVIFDDQPSRALEQPPVQVRMVSPRGTKRCSRDETVASWPKPNGTTETLPSLAELLNDSV